MTPGVITAQGQGHGLLAAAHTAAGVAGAGVKISLA